MLNAIMISFLFAVWLAAMIFVNRFMALDWKKRTAISLAVVAIGFAWIIYEHATGTVQP